MFYVSSFQENSEGADPVLRERQRRTKSVGPHYPDQSGEQSDDEDESRYPDADGRDDDRDP